ncbi:hypothetical protein CYMTET_17292 [Cymbomonas tetramitiformis]|uniref:Uncharacterized protein n=1 Tax=Cymbomonas tetramitiformis TaxID=36881 RepID=A0AAE0GAK8_9CHLO|nr:hypothetical protein CYMTET_17292 [Cymbomonas tetramitiformis]
MSGTTESLATKYFLVALSGMSAEAATFPIDMTKTRMQLQGELNAAAHQRGFLASAAHIFRTEGFSAFYKGVSPAILRHVPYTGTRIICYEQVRSRDFLSGDPSTRIPYPPPRPNTARGLRDVLANRRQASGIALLCSEIVTFRAFRNAAFALLPGEPGGTLPFHLKLAVGATSGAIGQLVAVPADVVKVRMQADGRLVASGKLVQPRYRGLVDVSARLGLLQRALGPAPMTRWLQLV